MADQVRILVIDDSPVMLKETSEILASEGYSVAGALTGTEGIRLAEEIKPDLILINVVMPEINWIEICRRIKADSVLNRCLVVLLSREMTPSEKQVEGPETEVDGYIERPVSGSEMVERIESILRIKTARESLHSIEDRFCLMYEKAPVPYQIIDVNGCILSVNLAWEAFMGYAEKDVLHSKYTDFLSSSDADKFESFLTRSSGNCHSLELDVRKKDGSSARILFNGFQEIDNKNKVQTIFCIIYDITEKLLLQEQILKNQQLEFTATLAGGIAHDFNNLMMTIMGNLSLAQLYLNPDDKASKILQKAELTCNQAKELINKFIVLSKGSHPSKKPLSIVNLLRKTIKTFENRPGIQFVFESSDNLWNSNADESLISYAIENLLSNAIQAMPNGGKVHIQASNITSQGKQQIPVNSLIPNNYIHIRVIDQGLGIPPEHLPRIFDPYYTTKELGPQKGMGLGLTTVYSIIHKHDGYISIKSELNKGTTVDIYIPALTPEATYP